MDEKGFTADCFNRYFAIFPERRYAVYGIGAGTKNIIDNCDCKNIVALMDGTKTGEQSGLPIITTKEFEKYGITDVIIVSRVSNINLIYRRIATHCKEHNITVYHISGRVVTEQKESEWVFNGEKYEHVSVELLKRKILQADVISFDIFDTVVMRKCLYPRDIFELCEEVNGKDFAERRVEAELAYYNAGKQPTINDIYADIEGVAPDEELRLEKENIILRDKIADIIKFVQEIRKPVYFVSDMYLPSSFLNDVLCNLKIDIPLENYIISCEYGDTKQMGLFKILKKNCGNKRILHIGNDYEADIAGAEKCKINDTFRIYSALDMIEDSAVHKILDYDGNLQNRLVIGELAAKLFNDPFMFQETRGKLRIKNNYELGYYILAPLIFRFFLWVSEKSKELGLDIILIAARDGFLFSQLYDLLKDKQDLPRMQYFYTSRTVAVFAGLFNEEDIIHAMESVYAGTAEELLKFRFHLTDEKLLKRFPDGSDIQYVLRHKEMILETATLTRKNYLKYISKMSGVDESKIGFFDFVSTGTTLNALSKILPQELIGMFFMKISDRAVGFKNGNIYSMCGEINGFRDTTGSIDNYIFLESVLTSYEPMVYDFNDDGNPIFVAECRSEKDLKSIKEIHKAIIDYAKKHADNHEEFLTVDLSVFETTLDFIKSKYSIFESGYFEDTVLSDEYFNRKFALKEMIEK